MNNGKVFLEAERNTAYTCGKTKDKVTITVPEYISKILTKGAFKGNYLNSSDSKLKFSVSFIKEKGLFNGLFNKSIEIYGSQSTDQGLSTIQCVNILDKYAQTILNPERSKLTVQKFIKN
jgi:hypothetical protein